MSVGGWVRERERVSVCHLPTLILPHSPLPSYLLAGAVVLPIKLSNGEVVSLGEIQPGRPNFDLPHISYPVGFHADLKLRVSACSQ